MILLSQTFVFFSGSSFSFHFFNVDLPCKAGPYRRLKVKVKVEFKLTFEIRQLIRPYRQTQSRSCCWRVKTVAIPCFSFPMRVEKNSGCRAKGNLHRRAYIHADENPRTSIRSQVKWWSDVGTWYCACRMFLLEFFGEEGCSRWLSGEEVVRSTLRKHRYKGRSCAVLEVLKIVVFLQAARLNKLRLSIGRRHKKPSARSNLTPRTIAFNLTPIWTRVILPKQKGRHATIVLKFDGCPGQGWTT